jgi:hypothetical protein
MEMAEYPAIAPTSTAAPGAARATTARSAAAWAGPTNGMPSRRPHRSRRRRIHAASTSFSRLIRAPSPAT